MLSVVTSQAIPGHSGVTLLARVLGQAGVPITAASLSAVSVTITDLTAEATLAGSGLVATLGLSTAVVLDSLQTGPLWSVDSIGYNVLVQVPAVYFAASGDRFRCDLTLTPLDASMMFQVPFEFQSLKVYG